MRRYGIRSDSSTPLFFIAVSFFRGNLTGNGVGVSFLDLEFWNCFADGIEFSTSFSTCGSFAKREAMGLGQDVYLCFCVSKDEEEEFDLKSSLPTIGGEAKFGAIGLVGCLGMDNENACILFFLGGLSAVDRFLAVC